MAFTIIPAHDERVTVEIHVPVKGRKTPLKFIAPRFEFIPREQTKQFDEWMTKLAADAGDEELMVTDEMMLNFWIEHLELKDADALLELTRGEKRQIWQHWAEVSNTTLGESEASTDS